MGRRDVRPYENSHELNEILVSIVGRPANDDMCRGYLDGRDPDSPAPGGNSTRSYRHGFQVGRSEIGERRRLGTFEEVRRMADRAMALDYAESNKLELE